MTGQIQVSAAASLTNPTVATGIKQLEIYIDGKPSDTPITAANGTFTIDTTLLSDGQHELRIVAINNALAESEAADIRTLHVNNHNRSISTLSSLTLDATQVAPVAITTSAGDGAVSRIELRQLGRVLGSTNAANGNINLDAAALAYGDNPRRPRRHLHRRLRSCRHRHQRPPQHPRLDRRPNPRPRRQPHARRLRRVV